MEKIILAVDVGGTNVKTGLFIGKNVVDGTLDSEPANSSGALEEIKKGYIAVISRGVKNAEARGLKLDGIHVDIPAPFDYEKGISHMEHKYASIKDVPLRPWFEEAAPGVPVRFMHDSAAFIQGAAVDVPDCKRIAGVMIGTGFGFGMMIDGEPLRKESGEPLIERYDCPYNGTIAEEYVSLRGLVRMHAEESNSEPIPCRDIIDGALAGDEAAIRAYRRMAKVIADVLVDLFNEYKIEALVLGGQISRPIDTYIDVLWEGLKGVPTLKKIVRASDLELVHLLGTAVGK